ncbi:MAG: FG-GAP-like repeat-containing protein [Candidatus Eisenbacteria bacterium]
MNTLRTLFGPRALSLALSGALLALAASAHAQSFNLGAKFDLLVGGQPTCVTFVDLNGDGKLDMISGLANGSVSVRLGDGAGSYGSTTTYPVPAWVQGMAVGDVNGDGRLDVAATYTSGLVWGVSVLLGDGAGGFGPATNFATGHSPQGIAIVDLNGDGKPDLVVANRGDNTVSALFGNGSGGFVPTTTVAAGNSPSGLAAGDLNGDGIPDLAVANVNGIGIGVFFGDGHGGLSPMSFLATADNPWSVAITDLNGDGKPDLVAACSGLASTVSVLIGNGSGGFAPHVEYPAAAGCWGIAVGDLNGDGNVDAATVNQDVNSASIFLGNGTGGFGARTDYAVETQPFGVTIADVNGDGRPDVATANFLTATASVTLMLNAGSGSYMPHVDYATNSSPRWVALGDFNGDGHPDMATANTGTSNVSVRLGSGGGAFGPKNDFPTGSQPNAVAVGDVNLDGKLDLVVANYGNPSNSVSVLLGNGAGSFGAKVDFAVGAQPQSVAVADLNHDGKPDIVAANGNSNSVSVLLGSGTGTFAAAVGYGTGLNPISVAVDDLNGDGIPDLVTANYYAPSVSVLIGNGTGTFAAKVDYPVGGQPGSVAIGDVNGDGKPDLVVANSLDNTFSVLLGTGSGTFGARTDYPTGIGDFTAAIGDVNGDGHPDIVTANYTAGSVSVLLGNGSGSTWTRTDYTTGAGTDCVVITDVNGDGRPDVVVTNQSAASGSVLLALELTRTSLNVSPRTVVKGTLLTLTANVAVPSPGSGAPTGTVRFYDGATLVGTAPVTGGNAGVSMFAPYLGDRVLSAVYSGDASFFGNASPAQAVRVVSTASPSLASIRDVGSDQGGRVRVRIRPSPFDIVGSGTPITSYELYRRISSQFGLGADPAAAGHTASSFAAATPASVELLGWDLVGTLPAHGDSAYVLVAPTLADSNASGIHRAVFMVRATTASPSTYFDSPADSGYSVDNLPPAPPAPLVGAYSGGATHLHWAANTEPDIASYHIYRGSSAGFVPGAANRIATLSDTGYVDAGAAGSYYKLSAVDVNGNESAFGLLAPDGTTGVSGAVSVGFALSGVAPNPGRADRMVVAFSLESAAPAQLEVYDVSGRRVASQEVGGFGAGHHTLDLGRGQRLAAGLYMIRLTQAGRVATARAVVVE